MLLEQSTGSVIAYVLNAMKAAEPNLTAYYESVPERFMIPSVLFPAPEIEYHDQTLTDFILRYIMFVVVFGSASWKAHQIAEAANMAVHVARDKIPLLGEDGTATGRIVRVRDTSVRTLEAEQATTELAVTWDAPYKYYRPEVQKMQRMHLDLHYKWEDRMTAEDTLEP